MAFTGGGGSAAAAAASSQLIHDEGARSRDLRLSPRQQLLDRRWAYYRTEQYNNRSVAWDGSKAVGQVEYDSIALAGYVPPGFYISSSETLPIKFRRPSAPYHLVKVIVDRFTGLLFGQKRHPRIDVDGDPDSEDFLNAVAEVGRLWHTFMQARAFGGGTGTAVVGFKLLNGRPVFEVFDPRWCHPKFADRAALVLAELEYRYTFPQERRDPETGEWVEVQMWYRRVVDQTTDTIFKPAPVQRDGRDPTWEVTASVTHNHGFCPIVWIQNQPNITDLDGDPDCIGAYDMVEAIDRLNAQSERGILANCDPTVVISTDAAMGEVRKGSANAIKMPAGGSAQYMEMNGSGIQQAREQAGVYKDNVLEVAQCVLEQPDGQKTATEVVRNFAAMLAKADTLREQYGEIGVKRLLNMVLTAAARLTKPRTEGGAIVRSTFTLPKKLGPGPNGKKVLVDQKLGPGPYQIQLTWPPYFEPDINDANNAVQAAVAAKTGGLVDDHHASKLVAPYFQIEDVGGLVDKMTEAAGKVQGGFDDMAMAGPSAADRGETEPAPDQGGATAQPGSTEAKDPAPALNGAQVTALQEVVASVARRELPRDSAVQLIIASFPITEEAADKILGEVGKTFFAAEPAAPTGWGK